MDIQIMYFYKIIKGIINNISKNYRYYDIKILLDLITDLSILGIDKKYSKYKYSKSVLVFLCATIVQELLRNTDIVPRNYRSFLSKFSNCKGCPNVQIEPNVSFCKQIHNESDDSKCFGTFYSCMKSNFIMFIRNYKILISLYSKLYAIPIFYKLWIKKNINSKYIFSSVFLKTLTTYIKNINLSSFSFALFYFISQSYLTIIEHTSKNAPDKLHYNFGISIGAICLTMGETKSRLGMITHFMTALYINIFFQKTIPGHEYFWKNLFPFLLCFSFLKRGIKKTIVSII